MFVLFIILSGVLPISLGKEGADMRDYGNEIAEFLYYTPGKWDKSSGFWPVRAGRTITKTGYRAGPKKIESYSMHFVRAGTVILEYGERRATLVPGDIFCIFPMRTYVYQPADGKEELRMSWLAIDGLEAERMLGVAGLTPEEPYVSGGKEGKVRGTLDRIMSLMRNCPQVGVSTSLSMQSLLYRLFARLAEEKAETRGPDDIAWIKRSRDYIDLHATEGITVRQAAEVAGVNRTYFSSVFAEQTGMTPKMYIDKVRMDKAKRRLADTRDSVTEIAYSLGYSSLFAFTRAFKSRFSLTPTEYRAAARGTVAEGAPTREGAVTTRL
ncbi:AraC family transcriptional regulator [Paenibacillus sp. GCM10027626]|uniref:AraC family transcriptional regulator n=1 Tax=Paenibacillus sp. GCM10027626 TaxID=3273411 RepID=UPI00363C9259